MVNKNSEWLDSPWGDFFVNKDQMKVAPTGIPEDVVQKLGIQASSVPKDLKIHSSKAQSINQSISQSINQSICIKIFKATTVRLINTSFKPFRCKTQMFFKVLWYVFMSKNFQSNRTENFMLCNTNILF